MSCWTLVFVQISQFFGSHREKLAKSKNLYNSWLLEKINVGLVHTTYGHISRLFLRQFAVKNSLKFTKCQLSTRGPIVNGEVVPSPRLYEAQTYEKNFSFHLEAFHKSLINAYLDYHAWAAKLALICQAAHSLCLTVGPNGKNLPITGFKNS